MDKLMQENPERAEMIFEQRSGLSSKVDVYKMGQQIAEKRGMSNHSLAQSMANRVVEKLFNFQHMDYIDGKISAEEYQKILEKLNKEHGGVFNIKEIMSLKK